MTGGLFADLPRGEGPSTGRGEREQPVRRLSLVRLSGEIARSLAAISRIAVEGEVHRPSGRPGGRIWFTLRDRAAQITVTCPAARARNCRVVVGERVCVTGRLVYANDRGQVQLEAEEVVPVGAGAIAAAIVEARTRLAADGLLDRPRRRIPVLPEVIGVVCGADAAVRADIESVIAVRFPGYPVDFVEVGVSGPGAVDNIVGALGALDGRDEVEVIVLARGGGDAVQLLPFSDELLCRAVCACRTPVVSAIGHEGDRPLCDEVVDLRCGTPSLAAAAVVPDRGRLQADLDHLAERAASGVGLHLNAAATRLAAIDRRRAVRSAVDIAAGRLARVGERLPLLHPGARVATAHRLLETVGWQAPMHQRIGTAGAILSGRYRQLEALSPARVLERGYAVVRAADGSVLRDASAAARDEAVTVELAVGGLRARVEETWT